MSMYIFLGVKNDTYTRKDGKEVRYHELYLGKPVGNGYGYMPILDYQKMSRPDGSTWTKVNKGYYVADGRLDDVLPADWDKHLGQECDIAWNEYGRPMRVSFIK